MLREPDPQPVEDAECRVEQYEPADEPQERDPSPLYQQPGVDAARIPGIFQQFGQYPVYGPVGHEHTGCACGRQHAGQYQQSLALSGDLEEPGQPLFCLLFFHGHSFFIPSRRSCMRAAS